MEKRSQQTRTAIEWANKFFAESPDSLAEQRKGVQSFLSACLMESNSYRGFNYLYWLAQGCDEWIDAGRPEFPEKERYIYGPSGDQTRVVFY